MSEISKSKFIKFNADYDYLTRMALKRPPLASLSTRGMLFNVSFCVAFLENANYVKFYFEEDSDRLAIKPLGEKERNSKTLRGDWNSRMISCVDVINQLGLDTPKRYKAIEDKELGLIILEPVRG